MTSSRFHPRQHPQLVALLQRILERILVDVPAAVGVAVTVHDKRITEEPSVLAALGVEGAVVGAQLSGLGGPVSDALAYQVPVLTLDLWTDERYPQLNVAAVTERAPEVDREVAQVRGAAAVPGFWRDDAAVVVSCALAEPATAVTVTTLIVYEQLISAALMTTAGENAAEIEDLLTAVQSRGAIEQAKGALMGLVGCDAGQAWNTLRRASQEFNVKLRELAVALLEYISDAPAEQAGVADPIAPNDAARTAAELLWTALSGDARQRRSS